MNQIKIVNAKVSYLYISTYLWHLITQDLLHEINFN